jgi:hypothetical protein
MGFISIYENKRMKPMEIVLGRAGGRGRMMERVNSTQIYVKHLCKYIPL